MASLPEFDARTRDDIRRSLHHELDQAGPRALDTLNDRLASVGSDWTYYPKDSLASRIHELLAGRVLEPGSTLIGLEQVESVAGKPIVIFSNHLSYADGKPPRAAARAARLSIDIARERLRRGDTLLVFPEGTRSRSGGLHRMLVGATRYIEEPDAWVLPMGIAGTEALFPVGAKRLQPSRIVVRTGRPFRASTLFQRAGRDRRLVMDTVGLTIAALLPSEYRGEYDDDAPGLHDAKRLFLALRD